MKYQKKKLSNGMTIILVPIKDTKIITMGFFVKAGARNETEKNNGIAHFLEHMMFKGTTNRTSKELFDELDYLGTIYNAATTMQHTFYYIYGNSDDTKKLLDIILDIYINPLFGAKEISKEKNVIIEEMRLRFDTPYMKLYAEIHLKIFAGTSLARQIIGTVENIENFKKKDLVDFRKKWYTPEETVFVVTGNFNPTMIYRMIKDILVLPERSNSADVTKKSQSYQMTRCEEKEIIIQNISTQTEPYVYIKKNVYIKQVYVILVFPLYDLYKTKSREIDLLTQLLASGSSSRLSTALREKKGITYEQNAYPIVYSDVGLYLIQMTINPSDLIMGLKIVFKELKKTKRKLISNEEMTKIYNISKNDSIYSLVKPSELLTYFGLNFLHNRNFNPDIDKELRKLKKIKPIDIQNVCKDIFVRDKINLFMYGNVTETDFDFIDL